MPAIRTTTERGQNVAALMRTKQVDIKLSGVRHVAHIRYENLEAVIALLQKVNEIQGLREAEDAERIRKFEEVPA